jgi:hypothetical protein
MLGGRHCGTLDLSNGLHDGRDPDRFEGASKLLCRRYASRRTVVVWARFVASGLGSGPRGRRACLAVALAKAVQILSRRPISNNIREISPPEHSVPPLFDGEIINATPQNVVARLSKRGAAILRLPPFH